MRGCYIGNNRVLVELAWGGKMMVHADDLSLTPDLIIHGVYDIALTNFILKHVKPGQTFVDVGANMGVFTILAAYQVGINGKVFALEASPKHCLLLTENLAMNYMTNQATVLPVAVYSQKARLTFHATQRFLGNGSLTPHDEQYKRRYSIDQYETYEVDAAPLDDLLKDSGYIHVIKIDIEGGEYHALLGFQNHLREKAVGTLLFELNKQMLGKNWFPLYNRLAEFRDNLGYTFGVLSQAGDIQPVALDALFTEDEIPAVVMFCPE